MKAIFDAIRAEFAHQDRRHPETSVLLGHLNTYQRSIRGFSHRLTTICGLAKLSREDADLQRRLREALISLLQSLGNAQTWGQGEDHPALHLRDETGYLRSTTLQMLQRYWYGWNGYNASIFDIAFTDSKLTFTLRFKLLAGGQDDCWSLPPITLQGQDLDTLAGAAKAILYAHNKLRSELQQATSSPEHKAWLANKKAAEDALLARDARISTQFCKLLPADLEHCRELARGTKLAKYFEPARSF